MSRLPPEVTMDDGLIERLWHLHRRGLSYASDTPAVNSLLANLSEGIEKGINALNAQQSEIASLRGERDAAVEEAWDEGWDDGFNAGHADGMDGIISADKDRDWEKSETRAALTVNSIG